MNPSLKTALESLDKALTKLDKTVEKKITQLAAKQTGVHQAELSLDIQHERELNRLLAAKIDSTIDRLETILKEEGQ